MFERPPLPYDHAALEPVISRETMRLHHGKHHQKYIDTTNDLLAKAQRAPASLEEVVRDAAAGGDPARTLFDNAAQAWNHAFFWAAMSPSRQAPESALAQAIARDFGGLEALKSAFVKAGTAHFGSGWVWLAAEDGALKLLSTHDAEDLLVRGGLTPLLVCDLWEHAYYLDHHNDREGFLKAWFEALPAWDLAGRQYAAARGRGKTWTHPAPVAAADGTAKLAARSS